MRTVRLFGCISVCAVLLLVFGARCHAQQQLTVLVTASNEIDRVTNATGAATNVGGVLVGAAGKNTSVYEHSEIWEVIRRFQAECHAASFVSDAATPHSLTIHVDYQKVNGGLMLGTVDLYQLVLLNHANNPLYISKKNWLRREIKPVCKAIQHSQQEEGQ